MNNKLLLTLTIMSLSLVAFLSGYLISQSDFKKNPIYETGNFLDKFEKQNKNQITVDNVSDLPKALSTKKVLFPEISADGQEVIFYEKNTSNILGINVENFKERTVNDEPLPNVLDAIWSPSKKGLVLLIYYPNGNIYSYLDLKTKNLTRIGRGIDIESLAFSPDGTRVAYIGPRSGVKGVFLFQLNGGYSKKIIDTRMENAKIYWPTEEFLALKTKGGGESSLYSLSKTGDLKKIIDEGESLEVNWSKDGKTVLFSTSQNNTLNLHAKNPNSSYEITFSMSTPASKCVWSTDNKTVFCATSSPSNSWDEIYELTTKGNKEKLISNKLQIRVQKILLEPAEEYFVITDTNNKAYVLPKNK